MASNKLIRFGPVGLTAAAANLINPPTLLGGVGLAGVNANTYVIVRHIRITNKSAAAVTASFFIGASGASLAGTEFGFSSTSIPAGSYADWYGALRLDATDYLTGLASAAGALTFVAEGEIGIE